MTLNELQRIKQWHVHHRQDHPLEYHLWDAMLTLWLMGWVGWLPLRPKSLGVSTIPRPKW